jgi:transposase
MSEEEEKLFLEPFYQQAERGELTTAKEIHRAYEEKIGHKVHKTTIYDLLKRHGWRKILPRGRHPKAEVEAQETFKKNSPKPLKKRKKTENLAISDPSVI